MIKSDAAHPNQALQDALARIYTLHRKDIDLRLESGPYRDILKRLGNPQNRLPPVIHVAGTNGKGSTIAMMRALAESRGLKVHAYTSPHLFRFNERLVVAGQEIDDHALLSTINYINTTNSDNPLTFFEFTSALMFHVFAENPADLCLIEVGMGGRLDCTNVIEQPAVTVITSLSYDHMAFLGDTMEQIAAEKAGIIKDGVPCVVASQRYPEVLPVIEARAARLHAPIVQAKADTNIPDLPLKGAHQRDNAAAAMAAMRILYPDMAWPKPFDVSWPGRFQRLQHDVLDVIYDGAHNEDSLKVLGDTLRTEFNGRKVIIGLAMQNGKDVSMIKNAFHNLSYDLHVLGMPAGNHPQTATALKEKLEKQGLVVTGSFDTPAELVAHAETHHKDAVLVFTGSLYLAQLIPGDLWPTL